MCVIIIKKIDKNNCNLLNVNIKKWEALVLSTIQL